MISVCMTTYNGEKYLRGQVDSILGQLSNEDELIISDDGSTDSTIRILESYNDSRIKILHNTKNHGVNGNFENALINAKGDYIFLSDQDDVWHNNKVRVCISALDKYDCIVHDCEITDSELNIISNSLFKELGAKSGVINNLKKNGFTGCCMAFKKSVLNSVIPFPKSERFFHDQWIGLRASMKFKTAFINQKLIYFRRHSSNSSSAAGKSKLNILNKIYYRILLCKALIFN